MRHFRSSLLLALSLVAGCAFEDGVPWGRADFLVDAAFAPPSSRLDGEALITSSDYRVDLDTVELTLTEANLHVSSSGEVASFDPANPPPGYSLCHNGHCHADSGELVDYEDIVVGDASSDSVVTQSLRGAVSLKSRAATATLAECSDNCHIPRGALASVDLHAAKLRLRGTVTDPVGRLTDPVELDLEVPLDAALTATITGVIGPREPGLIALHITLNVPPHLFDGIDFSTSGSHATTVADNFKSHAALNVEVSASDL